MICLILLFSLFNPLYFTELIFFMLFVIDFLNFCHQLLRICISYLNYQLFVVYFIAYSIAHLSFNSFFSCSLQFYSMSFLSHQLLGFLLYFLFRVACLLKMDQLYILYFFVLEIIFIRLQNQFVLIDCSNQSLILNQFLHFLFKFQFILKSYFQQFIFQIHIQEFMIFYQMVLQLRTFHFFFALFLLSIGLGFIVEKETDQLPPLGLFFGYFVVLSSFRFVYECLGSIL